MITIKAWKDFGLKLVNQYYEGKKHFLKTAGHGFMWAAPIWVVLALFLWAYGKIDTLTGALFRLFGFNPDHYTTLWTIIGGIILVILHFFLAIFLKTGFGVVLNQVIQKVLAKVPFYSTSKSVASSFNSDENSKNKVLIALVPGIIADSYMEVIMGCQKESVIKDHYTVTATMTPLPTGGFTGNIHKSKIRIIEEASFDDYAKYLISMGTTSFCDVLEIEPKPIEDFPSLEEYFEKQKKKQIEIDKKSTKIKVKAPIKTEKKKGRPKL